MQTDYQKWIVSANCSKWPVGSASNVYHEEISQTHQILPDIPMFHVFTQHKPQGRQAAITRTPRTAIVGLYPDNVISCKDTPANFLKIFTLCNEHNLLQDNYVFSEQSCTASTLLCVLT